MGADNLVKSGEERAGHCDADWTGKSSSPAGMSHVTKQLRSGITGNASVHGQELHFEDMPISWFCAGYSLISSAYRKWHRQHLRADGVLFYDPVLLQTPNI